MASGKSFTVASSAFDAGDADQTIEYRSLSVSAILGLVLGLLSPLVFGATLLVLIPIAGIAVSVFAIHRINVSEGALAGRWAAYSGLFLSAAMVVAPTARAYVIQSMRAQQAQDFGTEWLGMVAAGNTKEAFRLINNSSMGSPPPMPGEKATATDPYDAFLARPVVKALSIAGADATIRCTGTTGVDAQTFPRVFVNQRFEVVPATNVNGQPVKAQLIMERTRLAKEGRSRWIVWSIEDADKPAAAGGKKP